MRTIVPSKLLRFALTADAVVSGAVAALQVTAPAWLGALLHLQQALILQTGLFLIAYTVLLVVLARSAKVWSALIALIVFGNLAWAIACAALLALGKLSPNALGVAYVLLQAMAVLVFAALEWRGLQQSSGLTDECPHKEQRARHLSI